jgi:hypothetical protein
MQGASIKAPPRGRTDIRKRIQDLKAARQHELHPSRLLLEQLSEYNKLVISRATLGKAITPRQYIDHIKKNPDGSEASILIAFKNCYIVTRSHKLARKVLSLGKLLIPIVVRFASSHLKTFEQFLVHLETQNFIEVHFLNRDQKTTANFVVPGPVSRQEIARILRDPESER